jgi:UDP-2,4-diacetamido-2,4,6-trideoxy-beta-L-altropyranose hydrolase
VSGTLLIRADANVAIGTGHVMRCLALAQAWQDSGGQCIFAMAESTPAIEQRLLREKLHVKCIAAASGSVEDSKGTVRLARERNAAWVVLDSYHFDSAYQFAIKASGFKLLLIDDHGQGETYCADLVLNQNLHATPELYTSREPSTRLLLGPRYALLRREFRQCRDYQREIPEAGRKILVTMGGSDPNNVTAKVIEAIRQLTDSDLETVIMVGGSNPNLFALGPAVRGQKSMRLVADPPNVAELMKWADVAIAAAGTTFWEICCLGLPAVLLELAKNQKGVAAAADELRIAWSLGDAAEASSCTIAGKLKELLSSQEIRASQSQKGRNLVDGVGAQRVLAFLSELQLRRALASDRELYWKWANDRETRDASFRSKAIPWEEHVEWFRSKLDDPHVILYTATIGDGLPIGAVRYRIAEARAVLSITVGEHFRRRGWGQRLLAAATEKLFDESQVQLIDAYVKPVNGASLRLFTGAGFRRLPVEIIEGQEGIHFVLARGAVA